MNENIFKKSSGDLTLAPLRSLDDFIMESARFQLPQVRDLEKWGNRVVNNLLYYQSNYFLMSLLIILLVGLLHPIKMIVGFLVMLLVLLIFFYFTNERHAAARFKREHPVLGIILVLGGGYFTTYLLGSLVVFLFGIILPICATFIHASLRLRNIKNKIVNKMEGIGVNKTTPMGIFLEEMGIEPEI